MDAVNLLLAQNVSQVRKVGLTRSDRALKKEIA